MTNAIVCDFRSGCANFKAAFGPSATAAVIAAIKAAPHLAEALVRNGLASRRDAVNMARAIQEGRQCPMPGCACADEASTSEITRTTLKVRPTSPAIPVRMAALPPHGQLAAVR